jgi:hypothetical protein
VGEEELLPTVLKAAGRVRYDCHHVLARPVLIATIRRGGGQEYEFRHALEVWHLPDERCRYRLRRCRQTRLIRV